MKNVDSDEIENDIEEQVLGENDEHEETDDEALIYMFTEEYISSDEEINNDCNQQKLYADEIPEQIDEEDLNINFNWQKLGDKMKAYCNNYTSMRKFIKRKNLPDAKVVIKFVMSDEDIIDTIALKFWPKDGPKNHVPIEMFGKGNPGPRALAHALLGNQSRYWEVCVRVTFVTILKELHFLEHAVLSRGSQGGTNNRPGSYAHYSGHITPEITDFTLASIRTVY